MDQCYPTFKVALCGDAGVGKVNRLKITHERVNRIANALYTDLMIDIMDKKVPLFNLR